MTSIFNAVRVQNNKLKCKLYFYSIPKKYLLGILLIGVTISSVAQQTEGLVYNLRQNWVQYNMDAESFMPAISQASGNTISFQVDGAQYESYLLYIKNTNKAYLFDGDVLLTDLNEGEHYFKIDSLLRFTKSSKPLFSIYGEEIKNNLLTYIVSESFISTLEQAEEEHIRSKSYTSFFIISSILLLAGLIVIKLNSQDLFSQYSSVSRAFNLNTIDELIYKGRFFVNPGIQIIVWMSFSAAFVLHFLIIKLNIYFLDISWVDAGTIAHYSIYLIVLTIAFLLLFFARYLLVSSMATIFDMLSTKNVHYATYLRLTFYLLLVLQVIITLDYFSIITFSRVLFLTIIFGSLLLIIILIGIRLSFIIRHTFIQLILYLCGTEIILFVFVFKLVVG